MGLFQKKKGLPNMQEAFTQNLKYISQTELNPEDISRQFVKTQTRFYLTVGEVDCPTGKIVLSDPLCFLPSNNLCPQLALEIPAGHYPIEVSICRNDYIGIRMCTARLKIKGTSAVTYSCALPVSETAMGECIDGILTGFPVDAGMIAFCDAQVAEEYRTFLSKWHEDHPDGNHYDDYFAPLFAKSYETLPAYQREDGDFIEWENPFTHHKMVMVASGFGDGFYQGYWGYDDNNEVCELVIPMINPDLYD